MKIDNSVITNLKRPRVAILSSKRFALNYYLVNSLSHNFDVDLLIVSKTLKQEIKFSRKLLRKISFLGVLYYSWEKSKEHFYLKKLATKEQFPNVHSLSKMYFKENSEELCAHLKESEYGFILLGKSGLLDKRVLQSGAFRFINVHPAKLPEFRGYAEPAHALLLDKSREIGFTIHFVDEGIDTGSIIEWVQVRLQKVSSLSELLALVRFQGYKHFLQTTKFAELFLREKNIQKASFPILTFLNWKIRRKLDTSVRNTIIS